ncbi:hypothetical protein D3C76_1272820 [compost metagenome]
MAIVHTMSHGNKIHTCSHDEPYTVPVSHMYEELAEYAGLNTSINEVMADKREDIPTPTSTNLNGLTPFFHASV